MLTIERTFDEELGPGGMDPLGKLLISDGESHICINETYLDSWLAALIDSLPQLGWESHATIQTEEREPIEIDVGPDRRLVISYKDKRVVAEGVKELDFALRAAATRFFQGLEASPESRREVARNRLLDPIRRFLATSRN